MLYPLSYGSSSARLATCRLGSRWCGSADVRVVLRAETPVKPSRRTVRTDERDDRRPPEHRDPDDRSARRPDTAADRSGAMGAAVAARRRGLVVITVPSDEVAAFVAPPSLLAAGRVGGPLDGARLAVKDLFDVAGTVTGAGNPTYAEGRPAATGHATAVQRLLDAGASVIGKTITDELAFSLSGTNVHF